MRSIFRYVFAGSALLSLLGLSACGGGGGGSAPADLSGRILLVSSGTPLLGAVVTVSGQNYTTTADGTFIFHNISSTSPSITVTATGVQLLTSTLPILKANSLNDIGDVFVLNTADTGGYTATASGQVVRSDTFAVVPNATVKLSGHVTVTDSAGNFSFSGLPVGLGNSNTNVGVIQASGFEDKPILLDFPLVAPPTNNALGQLQVSLPVGGIPAGPTNIRGKVTLTGQTDYSGTVVTLINKGSGATVATYTTGKDGTYGFWVVAGSYSVKVDHVGPPAFASQTSDATLVKIDVPVTVNFTL